MGSFGNYLENKILDHIFSTAYYSQPILCIALFQTDPTEAGSGTEVSIVDTGYNRIRSTDWTISSSGYVYNVATIQFSTAITTWGTIPYFAIYDSSVSGNMIAYSSLTTSKTIGIGDSIAFSSGSLSIQLD